MRSAAIRRLLRDSGIVVLGSNLWASLVLIPALHLGAGERSAALHGAAALPLLALVAGLITHSRTVLLGLVPGALLAPLVVQPRLVGAGMLSAGSFALVAVSALAYLVGAAWLLQQGRVAQLAEPARPLPPDGARAELGRRRRRVFLLLTVFAGLFPVTLAFALFFDPLAREALRRHFPARAPEALALFGVLALSLWLVVFERFFYRPLARQVRGDRTAQDQLVTLGHSVRRPGPRAGFWAWVVVALVAMAALLWRSGR